MVSQHWVCSSCGTHVLAHSPFCFSCGTPRIGSRPPRVVEPPSADARRIKPVFWNGSESFQRHDACFRTTSRAGLMGWLAVLCVAVPCFIFSLPFCVRYALWAQGEWAGLGTLLAGMLLWALVLFGISLIVLESGALRT